MTNPNESAFGNLEKPTNILDIPFTRWIPGLTKREYFAAMAMQGILSTSKRIEDKNGDVITASSDICAIAAEYADALIAELNKQEK